MLKKSANTYIKLIIGVLFVVTVVFYTYIKSNNFIEGPVLTINTPQNGSTVTKSLIDIKGKAEHISHIQLNNNQIFVDEEGNIDEQLLLSFGYNIITIEADDRFGRKIKKTLEIIYN